MKDNDSIDISQDAWGEILATIKEVSDRIADLTIEHELDPRVAVDLDTLIPKGRA